MAVGFGTACPKPEPRKRTKARKQRAEAKVVRDVRETIVSRDKGSCRVCGRVGTEAHHIKKRSQGGKWTTENIILVCLPCHQFIHDAQMTVTGSGDRTIGVSITIGYALAHYQTGPFMRMG